MACGDFGLVRMHGWNGWIIGFLQLLDGDASEFTHVVVDMGDGTYFEATPSGARIVPSSSYSAADIVFSRLPLTDQQRQTIFFEAKKLVGTPYSYLDYLSIALLRLHIRPQWIIDYVASTGHMICSQVADYLLQKAGFEMFSDKRYPGDVTPGNLANRLLEIYSQE